MNKMTFFSLVAAALLFTACGEKTKQATEEATESVTEAVKEDSAKALEAAKAKASEVAEKTQEKSEAIAEAAAEKAAAAKTAVASEVAEVATAVKTKAEEVATAGTAPEMPAAYDKCKGCHGVDGKTKALGKSAVIAGQDKEALIASMKAYQAGTKNVAGMGMLMKGQVANMSDADIEAVAEYLSSIQ